MGPILLDQLKIKIEAGEVLGTDMAWRDGMRDWLPVSSLLELQGPPSSLTDPSSEVLRIPATQDFVQGQTRTSGLATASFVCGLLGILCLQIIGIPAIICGHMALKEIQQNPQTLNGRGMAITGLILGYLSVVIMVVILAVVLFNLAWGAR